GHAENVRAALHEQPRHLLESVAVGVRFDHGDNLHRFADAMADPGEIAPEGGEVHFSPAAMTHHAGATMPGKPRKLKCGRDEKSGATPASCKLFPPGRRS